MSQVINLYPYVRKAGKAPAKVFSTDWLTIWQLAEAPTGKPRLKSSLLIGLPSGSLLRPQKGNSRLKSSLLIGLPSGGLLRPQQGNPRLKSSLLIGLPSGGLLRP